jgi:hypothetical protein
LFATGLVAVCSAATIAFGAPVGEPPTALVASVAVMPAASPR